MATNGGGQLQIGRNGHQGSRNGGENLARILGEMSRPGINLERRRDGDRSLREYVEAEARDLSGQPFSRFMTSLYGTIQSDISSSDQNERLGGVLSVDELIDVKLLGENAAKISNFAIYLRSVFRTDTDPVTLEVAAATLGHLVQTGGALTADVVEYEVKRSLDWLRGESQGNRRYAAVLILREMAENAPAVFNVHVRSFIEIIWAGLRDAKVIVREASVAALRACLRLVEKRETRYRVQWYYRLFEETQRGLTWGTSVEVVHGSLLALGELLRHTGEFMLARYREVVETVLRFRESKERLIRRAVISLLPRLAAFAPERFAATYLKQCTNYLLSVLKFPSERGVGFTALGEMAMSLAKVGAHSVMGPLLPRVADQIKEAISVKGRARPNCPEALQCVGVLAQALGSTWKTEATSLVQPMMSTGLSQPLVKTLQALVHALPELLPIIQTHLLDLLSLGLTRKPYRENLPTATAHSLAQAIQLGELQGPALIRVALLTLGTFDFGQYNLLEFVRDHVMTYLDDPDVSIRRSSAAAAAQVLQRHVAKHSQLQNGAPLNGQFLPLTNGGSNIRLVEAVVERLLTSAVADMAVPVRRTVLESMKQMSDLDSYLAQADCLRPLFVALNDEAGVVRALAIRVVGRLAGRNPAYVMPALRRHLMQLLSDMDHLPDSRHREEGAHLLGCLIHSAPRLVMPYVGPILKALVSKLRSTSLPLIIPPSLQVTHMQKGPVQGGGETGVMASVLATTGELARVAGSNLRPHIGDILPLIIEAIGHPSGANKSVVAVVTLGQVIESTGVVVTPYMEYPQLLGMLLQMLSEGTPQARVEVLKVLGIVGALDPHTHKVNQANIQGEGKLEREGVRPQRQPDPTGGIGLPGAATTLGAIGGDTQYAGDLLPAAGLVTSSEDYYPTVAINALMRNLRDPAMSSHHPQVIRSLFYIFQALHLGSVPYLPKVMPVLFGVMRGSDDTLREFLFQQLTLLVSFLRQHVRKYLPDILGLVHDFWIPTSPLMPHILRLLSELSVSLRDDFRAYLPELLPRFIGLFAEAERSGNYDQVPAALHALESLGAALEDHLQLLLPALVRLICIGPGVAGSPVDIRRAALVSCRRLLPRMHLAGYSSSILHPLLRVLDGGVDELRTDALDTICSLALALGPDFPIFAPTVRKIMVKHRIAHDQFSQLAVKLVKAAPPCMSSGDDWEPTLAALEELNLSLEHDNPAALTPLPDASVGGSVQQLAVNDQALRRAWESSQRSTKEDWAEWMRHFAVELLKESPSHALRATHLLAQVQPSMARELFAAGFVSCWAELEEPMREALVRSLEAALASPSIPPEIVTTLLNLAEFMEHNEKKLPLDTRTLGALAEKCHAFAKALHYKEHEYQSSPETAVEALISINNHLRQPEAAVGILTLAQQHLHMELKESWYEKLNRWDEALEAYNRKYQETPLGSPANLEAALGRLRCLGALAEWEVLSQECRAEWRRVEPHVKREMAPIAAHAAWHMGAWDEMAGYVDIMNNRQTPDSSAGAFLTAVLEVQNKQWSTAKVNVERARELLGVELAALVGESYERAYGDMVRVQQLTELEEVIGFSNALTLCNGDPAAADLHRVQICEMWRGRLKGVQRNVEVWQALLSVRTLVLPMAEDTHTWLKFASLCRKSGRVRQSRRNLHELLGFDPLTITSPHQAGYGAGSGAPHVMFGYLKHLWATGDRKDALHRLESLVEEVSAHAHDPTPRPSLPAPAIGGAQTGLLARPTAEMHKAPLIARVHMRMGIWRWTVTEELSEETIGGVLGSLQYATEAAKGWAKAWHNWALFNVQAMEHYAKFDVHAAQRHVAPAVLGFFRSVALGQASGETHPGAALQDILRLLTLWFNHGSAPDVEAALQEGFGHVSIDTWLVVIPQVIARIHTTVQPVRRLIHNLLVRIGKHHPQALMYPLLVACKSQSSFRRAAAMSVVDAVRQHSATLVEQAQLVSQELIRMAILWHEMWHEALEEASRQYFGESNVEAMLSTLMPLHEMMQANGGITLKEIAFVKAYGRELSEAYEWCNKYRHSRKEAELHQAWDLYYHVFKRINKQLPSLTVLEVQYVAPALVRAVGLELAVPGTYIAGEPVVTIAAFAPQLHVITSKQRPRKLTIHGSDGAEYVFLLKGHEDLRQDERVMQLFGLVNSMLANDRTTAERDLSIARYAVIPLSPNSGLIGWVPNTDTLHALIREYRDARKIPLNVEHRMMLGMAPDYDHLMVIQKVEVFEHALDSTSGEDLHKMLWLKSRNSEVWLERRTGYTRSTAVMSMVGYLLGLGDRHPSNLMLDRYSGKLLHIDFGDCFEASMNREKFPEKVPFRLTRMMTKAMEVSGIEGNFRFTCENVVRVLRSNKDSVMAMLEAFVHDPLINWRLLNTTTDAVDAGNTPTADSTLEKIPERTISNGSGSSKVPSDPNEVPSLPRREARERELLNAYGQLGDANEVLNERAVAVMKRMSDKLTGRDFSQEGLPNSGDSDSVQSQVQRLIMQATAHDNLCQSYIGWCPFW
ncbi:TPA: hypothetical protein ACH3X2_002209 [Trebouxia sp. C0005]